MTRLDWNKQNVDKVVDETATDQDKVHIYALALAVQYILEQIKRQKDKEDERLR